MKLTGDKSLIVAKLLEWIIGSGINTKRWVIKIISTQWVVSKFYDIASF